MDFVAISLEGFIKVELKNKPENDETDLRKRLQKGLRDFQEGVKCKCGNDIWVIGSSYLGKGCFTCLTGEADSSGDYEIDAALPKNINEIEFLPTGNYFDDDGNELNPDLFPMPTLCLSCKKKDDKKEEVVCNLTRMDQNGEEEFICFAYENKYES